MPISIEEFKTAFASPSSDGGLQELDQRVDRTLKALNRAVENVPSGHASADRFRKVLVELVTRYRAAKAKSDASRGAGAPELQDVLRQAETVLDRVESVLASPPTAQPAPSPPTGGAGSPGAPGGPPGSPGPPQTPAKENVVITVVDIETNLAIDGAIVQFAGRPAKPTKSGQATFSLPPGDHDYQVNLDGYRAAKGRIQVKGDADVQKQVQLQSLARGIDIDGDVARAARLHAKFEKQANPTEKGKVARELIKLAGELEKRLSQARRDASGLPILTGTVQFGPGSKGAITEIPPFNSRDKWTAAVTVLNLEVQVLSPDSKGQNQPLKSAIVRFKDSQGAEQSEVTGEDGWVAFQAAVGKYDCEVSYPTYGRLQQSVELQGGARKLEFVLRPPPPGLAGAPDLVPVGINISDYVTLANIRNAQVTLGKERKVTDGKGVVWFKAKPGVWPYAVIADKYLKETGEIDVPNTKEQVVQVILLKSAVESSGDLLVKVLEKGTRKPVPKAWIRISSEQEMSDSHGEARFLRLPFEPQSVIVGGDGYKLHNSTFHHNREYATRFFEVELEPDPKP